MKPFVSATLTILVVTEINCIGIHFATSTAPRDKILTIKHCTKLSCSPQTLLFNCQGLQAVYFTLNSQLGRCFHPGLPSCLLLKCNAFSSKSPATDKTPRLPDHSGYERRGAPARGTPALCTCHVVLTHTVFLALKFVQDKRKRIFYACQNEQYHPNIILYKTQAQGYTTYGDMVQKKMWLQNSFYVPASARTVNGVHNKEVSTVLKEMSTVTELKYGIHKTRVVIIQIHV